MQIMWTSSSNAKKEAFQLDDIQHEHGLVECLSASSFTCKTILHERSSCNRLLLNSVKWLMHGIGIITS